jgi:hypothetical protein
MVPVTPSDRLDSWKAIASYLQRDVATVRRWEKSQGLPVRRIPGGRGRSVFAYTAEIDAWLSTTASLPAAEVPAGEVAAAGGSGQWHRFSTIALLVLLVVLGGAWWVSTIRSSGDDRLRVELDGNGLAAFDVTGAVRWRHMFPSDYRTFPSLSRLPVLLGNPAEVLAQTAHRAHIPDDAPEGGALMSFDLKGQLQRSFQFADQMTFRGTAYGPPWVMTTFAVNGNDRDRRLAVAAHHFIWDPSLVTVLDNRWQRAGTFVHPGWIESLTWLPQGRLLLGGFSNPKDGGVLVLLDSSAMNGPDPLRMIVMPRTEVNRASSSRFNKALIQMTAGRLVVHTIEVWGDAPAEALYEFTDSLDLVGASFSERYWEAHRSLEQERKLDHGRENCPDRDGPREIQIWMAESGWKVHKVR